MKNKFREIVPEEILESAFKLIGNDWMLITSGTKKSFNTMTASWGGLGVLWDKNICLCFIRPQRYTYKFMEKYKFFTFSFFPERYRSVLDFCGNNSGRDVDKIKATGITPAVGKTGAIYFKEAKLVIESKKIYFDDLNPGHFLEKEIFEIYPEKGYHRMYIGEVMHCLIK